MCSRIWISQPLGVMEYLYVSFCRALRRAMFLIFVCGAHLAVDLLAMSPESATTHAGRYHNLNITQLGHCHTLPELLPTPCNWVDASHASEARNRPRGCLAHAWAKFSSSEGNFASGIKLFMFVDGAKYRRLCCVGKSHLTSSLSEMRLHGHPLHASVHG